MCEDLIVKLAETAFKLAGALEVLDKSGLSTTLAQYTVEHAHNYLAGRWPVAPWVALSTLLDEMMLVLETARANGVKVPGEVQTKFDRGATPKAQGRSRRVPYVQ